MSSKWIVRPLGELLSLQRGHDLPSDLRASGTVPVIGAAGITGFHNEATTKGPGVVIGRSGVGSMGIVSYIDRDYWALNTTLYVTDFRGNDVKFIYYLLRTINFRQFDTGSAQASLNRNLVYPYRVAVPSSKDEQVEIAKILSALDDRISLLRETNDTLEAIGHALFKSWFVDFDPVHAKMQGRVPEGMDDATAALFPDGTEETDLGAVPRGWLTGTLSDIISESTKKVGSNAAEVLSAVQTGQLVKSAEHFNKRVHSENISKYKAVAPLAFAYNPSRINIGSIGVNEFNKLGAVSPIYIVAEPKSREISYFIWHHLRTNKFKEAIKAMASGTVRQSLSYRDFSSISLILPPDAVLAAFNGIRTCLYQGHESNLRRIANLIEMRDLMLPRLISGQLRLPDAQAEIEAIAA